MRLSSYALTALGALSVQVSANCNNIEFTGEDGRDGFTTYDRPYKVSETVQCTSDIAEPVSNGERGCAIPTYAMGLVVHPELYNATVDDDDLRLNIFELVHDNVPVDSVNFNSTIVMNFTAPEYTLKPNYTQYVIFLPLQECWDATLSVCDPNDHLEGVGVRACGYVFLPAASGVDLAPGSITYDGSVSTVQTDGPSNSTRPQPAYDDVKDQATNNMAGDDDGSAAASLTFSSSALAMSVLCVMTVVVF